MENYGYYSKILKKPFDTLEELKDAEEKYQQEKIDLEKKREEKERQIREERERRDREREDVVNAVDCLTTQSKIVNGKIKDYVNKYGSMPILNTNELVEAVKDISRGYLFRFVF